MSRCAKVFVCVCVCARAHMHLHICVCMYTGAHSFGIMLEGGRVCVLLFFLAVPFTPLCVFVGMSNLKVIFVSSDGMEGGKTWGEQMVVVPLASTGVTAALMKLC